MLRYLIRIFGPGAHSAIAAWLEPVGHAGGGLRLASIALKQNKLLLALALADRRCRIGTLPGAVDYVLRAELLHRTGQHKAARDDIARALEISPDDIFAMRKQLHWASPAERTEAARRLLELDRDPAIVATAVTALRHNGVTAIARASVIDGAIRGWAAWQLPRRSDGEPATDTGQTVVLEHGSTTDRVRLKPDPKHPLAGALGAANSFVVASQIGLGQWLDIRDGEGPLRLTRMFTGFSDAAPAISRAAGATLKRGKARAKPVQPQVTVIVPVHGDLDATRACLDSLLVSIAGEKLRARILIVNDASPEAGMADYLNSLAVDLIICPVNLGFVGAVNAALKHVTSGDIVLLNADTVVPAGVIGRLRAVACSADDIGTVTPLSNNGELTSLPVPFRENPLPDTATIARMDAVAAQRCDIVDLPTGIGFCLYVTRACLDAVGGLSEHYERGYGEDVHLCLAAREAGLRNVCATSIYVGHLGTRSFRTEKRRLVMRNAARVAARFPEHEHEVAAFVTADPLRSARHAIGRDLIADFTGPIVVAANGSRHQAEARLAAFASDGRPALLATFDRGMATWRTHDARGALAAETIYELPAEDMSMAATRSTLHAECVEVFSPEAFAAMGFGKINRDFDLHVCDAGAISHRAHRPIDKTSAQSWQRAIDKANRIIASDVAAHAFALANWPAAASRLVSPAHLPRASCPSLPTNERRLGVVLLNETPTCRRLLRTLAARMPRMLDDEPGLVVIGTTADDLGLMRPGGIMITGAAGPDEINALARLHRVTNLLALSSTAYFGSPLAAVLAALDLPLAQFTWTMRAEADGPDLWLTPEIDDDTIADRLIAWLMQPRTTP